MSEKYVNYVNLSDGTDLLDLRQDTVTPETLAEGATAHNAKGEPIVGTMGGGSGATTELVTCYIDLTTMSVSNVSHTYQEICEMEQANKIISIKCDVNRTRQTYGALTAVNYSEHAAYFQLIVQVNLGNGLKLYYFILGIMADNTTLLRPYIINTTSLGG